MGFVNCVSSNTSFNLLPCKIIIGINVYLISCKKKYVKNLPKKQMVGL